MIRKPIDKSKGCYRDSMLHNYSPCLSRVLRAPRQMTCTSAARGRACALELECDISAAGKFDLRQQKIDEMGVGLCH